MEKQKPKLKPLFLALTVFVFSYFTLLPLNEARASHNLNSGSSSTSSTSTSTSAGAAATTSTTSSSTSGSTSTTGTLNQVGSALNNIGSTVGTISGFIPGGTAVGNALNTVGNIANTASGIANTASGVINMLGGASGALGGIANSLGSVSGALGGLGGAFGLGGDNRVPILLPELGYDQGESESIAQLDEIGSQCQLVTDNGQGGVPANSTIGAATPNPTGAAASASVSNTGQGERANARVLAAVTNIRSTASAPTGAAATSSPSSTGSAGAVANTGSSTTSGGRSSGVMGTIGSIAGMVGGVAQQSGVNLGSWWNPMRWLGIIGGAETEATEAGVQVETLQAYLGCLNESLSALSSQPAPTVGVANKIQQLVTSLSNEKNNVENQIKQLEARASMGWKDIAKATMIKTILSVTKNTTTAMANKMLDQYKISDYAKYTEALASQVYNMKYINENYAGDQKMQMALRALVAGDNPLAAKQIVKQVAGDKAGQFINDACGQSVTSPGDPNGFMNCIASYGQIEASPFVTELRTQLAASKVSASGTAAAQQEVSQSQGFAPARNCSGAVDDQLLIDQNWQTAATKARADQEVLARLESALKLGQTTESEVAKARDQSNQSKAAWDALPGNGSKPVIIDVCEAINSPSSFIAKNLETFIGKHLDQAYSLQSENLPFMSNFLGGVLENFFTKIILGGGNDDQPDSKDKSKVKVMKEGGLAKLVGGKINEAGTTYNNYQSGYTATGASAGTVDSSMPKGMSGGSNEDFSQSGGMSDAGVKRTPPPTGDEISNPSLGSSGFNFR